MAFLTKIEAALKLGYSLELIDYFIKKCPKKNEDRKLPATTSTSGTLIDEAELINFHHYLNQPWPIGSSGRPHIPAAIRLDIKQESHLSCAICGHMDNGEIAHIQEVSETLNNSPDNLILLCPNHHSKYDYGFKPSSNVDIEVVKAAKTLKRDSRRRMLRYEANATKALRAIIELISAISRDLKRDISENLRSVNITELEALIKGVPQLCQLAEETAANDTDIQDLDKELARIAPDIAKQAGDASVEKSEYNIRTQAESIVSTTKTVLIDIDEVDCPHCSGKGQYGFTGRLCAYCGGSCFVSSEKAEAYDRDEIDEVDCPRCGGSGQQGLVGDICAYCGGDCVVTQEVYDDYDPEEIDEEDCPHCNGKGQYGWTNKLCEYCGGSCFVSSEKYEAYDRDEIDEVDCPRCGGSGQQGLVGDICVYCGGDRLVTQEEYDDYDPEEIDEEDCPHCNGKGQYGWTNKLCEYCGGSCFVSSEKYEAYDRDEIAKVDCPRCGGSGQQGLVGDPCALCEGDCVVSEALRDAYLEKYG